MALAALCLALLSSVASAQVIIRPDHDWTVDVSGYRFGVQGWGPHTCLLWGKSSTCARLPFWAAIGIGVAMIGSVGFISSRVLLRSRTGEQSTE
jgi:hypothetical protein